MVLPHLPFLASRMEGKMFPLGIARGLLARLLAMRFTFGYFDTFCGVKCRDEM